MDYELLWSFGPKDSGIKVGPEEFPGGSEEDLLESTVGICLGDSREIVD